MHAVPRKPEFSFLQKQLILNISDFVSPGVHVQDVNKLLEKRGDILSEFDTLE